MRLKNCSTFWKQWEFLHGLDICKSLYLSRQCTGLSSVFLQIKTFVDIERPSCYANGSFSASSKISFHGLPSKSKRPSIRKHSVVVIITVNSISFYETTICREIFSKYFFASIFVNFYKILTAHQNTFQKVLETSQKYTCGEVVC